MSLLPAYEHSWLRRSKLSQLGIKKLVYRVCCSMIESHGKREFILFLFIVLLGHFYHPV